MRRVGGPEADIGISSESDAAETQSLNPQILHRFSVQDAEDEEEAKWAKKARRMGCRGKTQRATAKAAAAAAVGARNCKESFILDKLSTVVLVTFLLGIALIIPGAAMRLDSLPTPFPFVALPLRECTQTEKESEGQYILATAECTKDDDHRWGKIKRGKGTLRVPLHEEFLLQGVHYMPRVAFPEHLTLSGILTFQLLRDDEVVAHADLELSAFKPERLYRLGVRGTTVPVYLPSLPKNSRHISEIGSGNMCKSPRGCQYRLSSSMVEAAAVRGAFTIGSLGLEMQPVSNLTLVLENVEILAGGKEMVRLGKNEDVPEILLSFHQYMLTDRQSRGVKICIAGITLVFVGLSLLCISRAIDRSKTKEP
ncbi:hypothetical protein AAMO2058_000364000 [Amorphochlora amoebiformis]